MLNFCPRRNCVRCRVGMEHLAVSGTSAGGINVGSHARLCACLTENRYWQVSLHRQTPQFFMQTALKEFLSSLIAHRLRLLQSVKPFTKFRGVIVLLFDLKLVRLLLLGRCCRVLLIASQTLLDYSQVQELLAVLEVSILCLATSTYLITSRCQQLQLQIGRSFLSEAPETLQRIFVDLRQLRIVHVLQHFPPRYSNIVAHICHQRPARRGKPCRRQGRTVAQTASRRRRTQSATPVRRASGVRSAREVVQTQSALPKEGL
mmetsp:Transcript_35083/g.93546  ORF Transcript_35083/g.93546 Transcript_35083/m.93546 type:complete len:261 (-) Transcript_35083:475-1257(-)